MNFSNFNTLIIKKRYNTLTTAKPITHIIILKKEAWPRSTKGEKEDKMVITTKNENKTKNILKIKSKLNLPLCIM